MALDHMIKEHNLGRGNTSQKYVLQLKISQQGSNGPGPYDQGA